MKALVIAPVPFFTPRGTPFSVYYRALVMAEQGVEIDLLTYGQGQDVEIPGCRTIRIPRFGFLGPVKVGPSLLKLFLDGWMVLWTVGLLLRNRYAFVHAHEEAVFFCRALKPLFRFKLVYDMHSSLPQQLTNFKFTTSRALIGAFRLLERSSLRAAAAVITICPDLADYALSEGVEPERHFLIENSIFEDVRFAQDGDGTQDEPAQLPAAPGERPLIVYAGTLEAYQGIDILVRSFARVREERPHARLLVVGGTPTQVEGFRDLANELSLGDSCVFTGRVPKKAAAAYAAQASVLVSPRRQGTNTPLKIYEQLASGIPLVATNIWSHTQVLTDSVCFLVEPDPESMAQGLLRALNDQAARERVVAAALELYETEYSRARYESKIRQLLEVLR
ncbi:MAG TPA: glycosyltransferase [Longimicrobiales bacterium]|nr:glycosyltransferase [Longimicrobiales bacterium]